MRLIYDADPGLKPGINGRPSGDRFHFPGKPCVPNMPHAKTAEYRCYRRYCNYPLYRKAKYTEIINNDYYAVQDIQKRLDAVLYPAQQASPAYRALCAYRRLAYRARERTRQNLRLRNHGGDG